MSIALWSDNLATGIDSIDRQHHQLFSAINHLHEAFRQKGGQDQLQKCLEFLTRYTLDHFQTEEEYMQRHAYPDREAHVAHHATLLKAVAAMKARFEAGEALSDDVSGLLATWLKHHIYEIDMAYVTFLKARGVT